MEHFRSPIFVLQTNENADEQKISEKYAYLDWNPWRGGGGIFFFVSFVFTCLFCLSLFLVCLSVGQPFEDNNSDCLCLFVSSQKIRGEREG